jgi:hypothetical protein
MYKATVKHVAMGKNEPTALYCKSKSGNVYKFRTPVPADRAPTIIAKIKSAKVINTKHWIKVKEGKAPTKPAKTPVADKFFSAVDEYGRPATVRVCGRSGLFFTGGAA